MFTGLVEAVGRVARVEPVSDAPGAAIRLAIDPGEAPFSLSLGDSLAISGCCLTVAAIETPLLWFDVSDETLQKTTLGSFEPGTRVNLEPSATPERALGGHVVQGHVDTVGTVVAREEGGDWRLRFRLPDDPADGFLRECLVPKGSVTVDGVSLTIASLDPATGTFDVALIPVTLEKTTLSDRRVGDRINLEMDILSKTVVNWLRNHAANHPGVAGGGEPTR